MIYIPQIYENNVICKNVNNDVKYIDSVTFVCIKIYENHSILLKGSQLEKESAIVSVWDLNCPRKKVNERWPCQPQ